MPRGANSAMKTARWVSIAVEKGVKTAVVWLLFTLPLSLLEGGVLSERPAAVKGRAGVARRSEPFTARTVLEILDKRERGGPKWTAKMAQSLTASDTVAAGWP